jgi:hypothetical protein
MFADCNRIFKVSEASRFALKKQAGTARLLLKRPALHS